MKKMITVTALALAAISFVSTHASAQSAGQFDLILGFETTDATAPGNNTNLEIDLGPASNFTTSYSNANFSQLVGTDLSNTYGSGWATRTDLVWGVSGITSNDGTNTFDTTINTANPRVASSLGTPWGNIANLVPGFNAGTVASNSSAVTIGNGTTAATSIADSYSSLLVVSGGGDYGQFNAGQTQVVNTTGPDGNLELYGYFQGSGRPAPLATNFGTFSLSGSGNSADLSFTGVAAVPEPSSYALGFCAAILFWVLKRRRTVA